MNDILGSSIILKHENYYVFELQRKDKWLIDDFGNINIGVGCIGGKIHEGETPLGALYREIKEEILVEAAVFPQEKRFSVSTGYEIYEIDYLDEDKKLLFYWYGHNKKKINTYFGQTLGEIKPNDLGGVLLIEPGKLFEAFDRKTSVADLINQGVILLEKDEIPREAFIFPTGTTEVLYKLSKKEGKFIDNIFSRGTRKEKVKQQFISVDKSIKDSWKEKSQWKGEVIDKIIHIDNGFSLAAVSDGDIVGIISVCWKKLKYPVTNTIEAYIDAIEVLKEYRRKGVARALIKEAIKRSRGEGVFQIRAWSSEDKIDAIAMWRSLGFGLCHAETYPDGNKVHGYYVSKVLQQEDDV